MHLDIGSDFTTELYAHDRPVYGYQLSRFDMTLRYPHRPAGKLRLNLYGTKPAYHGYHAGLDKQLRQHGYMPSESDPCIYYKHRKDGSNFAGITIDNFIVLVLSCSELQAFKRMLQIKYHAKDRGSTRKYLGWTMRRTGRGPIHVSPPTLIDKSLDRPGLLEANSRPSPLQKIAYFDMHWTSPILCAAKKLNYNYLVRDLRYLADSTRSDIAFGIARLARAITTPMTQHLTPVQYVLRYL